MVRRRQPLPSRGTIRVFLARQLKARLEGIATLVYGLGVRCTSQGVKRMNGIKVLVAAASVSRRLRGLLSERSGVETKLHFAASARWRSSLPGAA